jgi:tripartite-type tricarboxylate transporter receptor subunit TctC
MKLDAHLLWTTLLCACVVISSARAVAGQEYPNRPIVLVVPFAVGGPVDVMSRTVADSMSRRLGQSVVIESAVGAGLLI